MDKKTFLKLLVEAGNDNNKYIAVIEAYLGRKLPEELAKYYLSEQYIKYDECKPTNLPWSEEMHYPLNMDPNHALAIIENSFIWDENDPEYTSKLPIATFLEDDCESDANMDDFIAVSIDQNPSPVWLWDHEGYFIKLADSLTEFLQTGLKHLDGE